MSQTHILVIDDDPAVREVVQETLRREGHTVSTAVDGAQGLQAAKVTQVHIVVVDLQLPDTDGLTIIERLAGLDANIIPIMMTGFGSIEMAVRAMKAGAFDFITHERGRARELGNCLSGKGARVGARRVRDADTSTSGPAAHQKPSSDR